MLAAEFKGSHIYARENVRKGSIHRMLPLFLAALRFFISAFRAYAVFVQCYSAQRAAVDFVLCLKLS